MAVAPGWHLEAVIKRHEWSLLMRITDWPKQTTWHSLTSTRTKDERSLWKQEEFSGHRLLTVLSSSHLFTGCCLLVHDMLYLPIQDLYPSFSDCSVNPRTSWHCYNPLPTHCRLSQVSSSLCGVHWLRHLGLLTSSANRYIEYTGMHMQSNWPLSKTH